MEVTGLFVKAKDRIHRGVDGPAVVGCLMSECILIDGCHRAVRVWVVDHRSIASVPRCLSARA